MGNFGKEGRRPKPADGPMKKPFIPLEGQKKWWRGVLELAVDEVKRRRKGQKKVGPSAKCVGQFKRKGQKSGTIPLGIGKYGWWGGHLWFKFQKSKLKIRILPREDRQIE
jgi:hypothetical protein